jgi:hypothetical protein
VAPSQSFSIFDLPNGQLIFQKWFCPSNPLDLANIVVLAKKHEKIRRIRKKMGSYSLVVAWAHLLLLIVLGYIRDGRTWRKMFGVCKCVCEKERCVVVLLKLQKARIVRL